MSKKYRPAVIAADLHLKRKVGLWAGRTEISSDDTWALECIAKLAKDNDADLFLLGDVLDSPVNTTRPMAALQVALRDLANEGRVLYIQGQHDYAVNSTDEQYPWLSLIPGAKHLHECTFGFMGLKGYALDYFPSAFSSLAFAKVPKDTEILLLHGTIDVALNMAPHFTSDDVKKLPKLKHLFAGDWHVAEDFVAGHVKVHYTGSTHQLSTSEPREKSVMLVTPDLGITRIPLKTRHILKLSEVTKEDGSIDTAQFAVDATLPKELQMPVLLIDQPAGPAIYEELAKVAHVYTTSAANPDVPTQASMSGAGKLSNDQILQQYVDKAKSPEQFVFTLDVIENPVDQAVKRLKDKFGIKDVDRTVHQDQTPEINLEGGDTEEEEVLA